MLIILITLDKLCLSEKQFKMKIGILSQYLKENPKSIIKKSFLNRKERNISRTTYKEKLVTTKYKNNKGLSPNRKLVHINKVRKTIEYSGNSIIQIIRIDKSKDLNQIRNIFKELGCVSEKFNDSLLADDVHYNEAGAEFIANKYYNVLINILE